MAEDLFAGSKAKARRAFERRFGKSMLPLTTRVFAVNHRTHVKVFDPETGSWAEYDTSARRIRRVAEHDAVN